MLTPATLAGVRYLVPPASLGVGLLDQWRQVLNGASSLVHGAALDREEQLAVLIGKDLATDVRYDPPTGTCLDDAGDSASGG